MFSKLEDLMVDNNVCGGFNQFCFNAQQKPPQLQYQPPPLIPGTLVPAPHNNNYMAYTRHGIAAEEAKQRQEIDDYLRLQNERLRLMLQEHSKRQVALLLKKVECRTELVMKQKNEEIAQAVKKRMELEDFLRKLEAENHAWQRAAQENVATVMSLNNTLEQFRERATRGVMEDAESCCCSEQEEEEEEDTGDFRGGGGFDNGVVGDEIKMMICKGCNFERSCVMFLPCRHLCSCKACEVGFDACPVCSTPKKASIEALIF
ncbi:probable BOI-related E3 ubiquitin-protein ligase 3 isoform X2 [Argentina anserina]|uniref:probable BOI-related E3 ubiquitin-protein ligase 3 isoform X2 n=1 Tax=Argentina anserina TaxID=57926 RepID=UPI0021767EED|nr:probable BOI-related E3 ubiquitin-protein ligase 3 isoform X2 [Potentilla anserina]